MGTVSPHFVEKLGQYFEHISSLNLYALAISAGTLLIIWLWGKIVKTIPGTLSRKAGYQKYAGNPSWGKSGPECKRRHRGIIF
jgi:MFS superfamily sulfate permease-like transporter